MSDQPETKSAINWDSKDASYQAYAELLIQSKSFAYALSVKKGLRKAYHPFKSQLYVFHDTVRGQFDKYLESAAFKEKEPNISPKDYDALASSMPPPARLLVLKNIIIDWAQKEGPFATLTEKLDPRQAW